MNQQQWVRYPWFEEHGVHLVHPEDLDRFRRLIPFGKLFSKTGADGDFVVLSYGSLSFRVKPELIQPTPTPPFAHGQHVMIRSKGVGGVVVDIGWHDLQNRPYFFLTSRGKRLSKRYFEEDLEPISVPPV